MRLPLLAFVASLSMVCADIKKYSVQKNLSSSHLPAFSSLVFSSDKIFNPHSCQFTTYATSYLIKAKKMIDKANKDLDVYVMAYSDDIVSAFDKKDLTQAQAESVASYLWSLGVNIKRLHAYGHADKYSIGEKHNVITNSYNRRVEVLLLPKTSSKVIYPESDQ